MGPSRSCRGVPLPGVRVAFGFPQAPFLGLEFFAAFGIGFCHDTSPRNGCCARAAGSARELVETRAAKEKSLRSGCCPATQNPHVESFHGRLREECLTISWLVAPQACFWLEWGSSIAGQSLPATRSRFRAVHSDSISTRPSQPVAVAKTAPLPVLRPLAQARLTGFR